MAEMPISLDRNLRFQANGHIYRYKRVVVRSVTQALDAEAMYDFGDANQYQLQQARERGSIVHRLTELDDLGELDEDSVDPLLGGYVEAWRRFVRESRFTAHTLGCPVFDPESGDDDPATREELPPYRAREIEHCLFNADYRYCGTLDRVGDLGGLDVLIDIKTGYEQRATGPQTAAYAACRKATAKLRRYGCYLHADGTYSLVPYKDRADWHVFLSCLTLINWRGPRHA